MTQDTNKYEIIYSDPKVSGPTLLIAFLLAETEELARKFAESCGYIIKTIRVA